MPDTLHNDLYRRLIDRLAEARSEAGMTQQILADRLDKPQSFVAKVEGYERRLDIIEFLEISSAIGYDPIPSLGQAFKDIRKIR